MNIRNSKGQFLKGELHPNYKRGYGIRKDGRVMLRIDNIKILRAKKVYCDFHNLKDIPFNYEIHHIDLDPSNDDIKNLQLMTVTEHRKLHMTKNIDINKIIELRNQNFSYRKIGRQLNIVHGTVKRHLEAFLNEHK